MEAANEPVRVRVRVHSFKKDAMQDDYADGRFASYDMTFLELLAPPDLAGREVGVAHDESPAADSFWTDVGAIYELTVRRESLRANTLPFAPAFSQIEKIADAPTR